MEEAGTSVGIWERCLPTTCWCSLFWLWQPVPLSSSIYDWTEISDMVHTWSSQIHDKIQTANPSPILESGVGIVCIPCHHQWISQLISNRCQGLRFSWSHESNDLQGTHHQQNLQYSLSPSPTRMAGCPSTTVVHSIWVNLGKSVSLSLNTNTNARISALNGATQQAISNDTHVEWSCGGISLWNLAEILPKTCLP